MAEEVGVGAVSSIVSEAAKPLSQKIKREISYVFKYQSYIDGLKNQVDELGYKRQRVEQEVNQAESQGNEIYEDARKWLISVKDFTESRVKPINEDEDEAKKRCFKGLCPNLFKRYNLSKKALKATKECADLLGRGNFNTVSYRPAPDLGSLVNQLELLRRRVEKNIEHAEGQGEEIHDDVKDWLTRVKNLTDKADKTTKEVEDLLGKGNFSTFSYLRTPDLESLVKELEFLRQRVEKDVEHAERHGEEIFNYVKDWLTRAKNFTDKTVNGDVAVKECSDLLGRGNFPKVSYRPAPDKTELMHVKDYEQFDSRMEVFQQVMEALKDNEFNIIGVYGMGGVGKTTLVKQVASKVMEDKLFDEVIMAEVTQTPDLKIIQDKLARDLRLEFEQQESVFKRADKLRGKLKKKKRVLIILDNIWTKLKLDDVGIPLQNEEKERKDEQGQCTIILTCRNQDLLQNDMNTKKDFSIEVLSKNEAWQMFEKIVGDSSKKSDFQPIADEIVGKCGGLPVALITIANALKKKSLPIWKDALDRLTNSNAREIHGMYANVYSSIELSYNFLESDEAKSLFLLCGLHRAGDSINVFDLLRYGMGLGLFKNVYNLEAARNRVHWLIDSLKASCLLLVGDAEDEVKMHDVIHAVAISIAKEKLMFNIPNVADLKDEIQKIKQKGPTDISLHCRDDYELPEQLECPQLRLFLLFTKGGSSWRIPDLIFNGMKELKVLLLDEINCIPSLPSSLGCLINLQTLCLDGCHLKDITIVGQLKGLKILSFRDSNIEQLPLEIGHLTRLQQLDLRNCWRLKVIAPNVISKLSRLEELYMGGSFTRWEKVEGGHNASLVELKGLSKLTTLYMDILDAETISQDFVSVELERFKISIGDVPDWYDKNTSRLMKIGGMEKGIFWENYTMKMLLKRTEDLYLEELHDFQNVVHELDDNEGFSRLKHFYVEKCSGILHIVSSVGRVHSKVFPLLESLLLRSLINLEKVCQGQITDDQSFSNLRIIKVIGCVRLNHLFSFSMAKNLSRLRKVVVRNCKKMEMIVGPDVQNPTTTLGFKEIVAEDDPHEKVIFPSLEKLKLLHLPELRSIAVGIKSVEFPSLLKVDIWKCSNLRRFISMDTSEENTQPLFDEKVTLSNLEVLKLCWMKNLTYIWDDHLASYSFSKLKKLKIIRCSQLRSIFPPMVMLPSLEVFMEKQMKNLTHIWDDHLASNSFRKLKELKVFGCSKLRSIFPPMVAFPSLMTLSVVNCNELRRLMTLSTATSMVNLTTLTIQSCEKMEEIIEEQVGEEKVKEDRMVFTFSQLKYLKFDDLVSLKCFCLGNYTLEFSSLERVFVSKCPNMKTFSQGVLATPKLYKVHTNEYYKEEEYWKWEGNLNFTIQKMYKEMVGFRDIEDLNLSRFPHLKEIWHSQALPVSIFNNLRNLTVDDCTNMSIAIPTNLLLYLNNLYGLKVSNCDSFEEVFHLEEVFQLLSRELERLELINLPKLQRLCNFTGNIIEFLSLSHLTIENCPNMEAFISNSTDVHMTANKEPPEISSEKNSNIQPFFDENKVSLPMLIVLRLSRLPKLLHLWNENSQPSKAFQNLKTLEVSKCDWLINMATLSTADESLANLERMEITDCKMIQEIIQVVGEEVEEEYIVFSKLKYLGLDCLPSLTSFCLGKLYTLEFPSLKRVLVRECPNMSTFSHGVLHTLKLHKVQIKEDKKKEDDDDDDGDGDDDDDDDGGDDDYYYDFDSDYDYDEEDHDQGYNNDDDIDDDDDEGDEDEGYNNDDDIDDDDDDDEGDEDEGRWEGNLNSTIQQLFKEMHIESLPSMVAGLWSTEDNMQLEATKFLKLLSIEVSPLIEEVIQSGVVERFVEFLRRGDFPQLQFEAASALTNIASGTSENTKVVIDHGAIPIFVELLASPSDDVREQVVLALGNVAGDSPRCRDFVLSQGALIPLLAQLNEHAKLSMLRNAARTLSNLVRGKPEPPFDQVRLALPSLAQLVHSNDNEVLSNACWALYHLSDGANDKIQAVIEAGVCPRLVELLGHPSPSVLIPALQTVANIVTGDDFQTQCIINHGALLYLLGMLTHNHKESIKKVVCRTISNITAGNREQIQAVIDAGLIGPLVNLLQDDEFDIKGEAAWAISNATAGGTHEQIKYLVSRGCIKPLCDLFLCSEPRIVTVCLEVLENILKVGEAEKNMGTAAGDGNKYAQLVEEAEGLEKIEILRSHDNNEINEKAIKILQTYWLEKE